MEFELDKEMDSLLRHEARRGLFVAEAGGLHLDADEISAFAENTIPQKARFRVTEHLADCDRCRASLANVVRLNTEAESETIHIQNTGTVTSSASVSESEDSLFKRFFAFPKLTFAMTAMMLLMTGTIAFIALRSINQEGQSVAQIEPQAEKPEPLEEVGSGTEAKLRESSNAATANAAANTATNAPAPAANTVADKTSDDAPQEIDIPGVSQKGRGPSETPSDTGSLSKDAKNAPAPTPQVTLDGVLKSTEPVSETKPTQQEALPEQERERAQNKQDNNYGNIEQNRVLTPDVQNSKRQPAPPPRSTARSQQEEPRDNDVTPGAASGGERADKPVAKKKENQQTRSAGGKTFRNVNGVWTDTAYSGGGTTSVRRGSDEYKKLDSGLQSIGNSIGGTVIVVWGGKAYRIQ